MNRRIILYTLGIVCRAEAGLMLLPALCGLIYGESEGLAYIFVAAISFLIGAVLKSLKPEDHIFYLKEGCLAVALAWIGMSCIGALPYVITGEIPYYPNALFETVSGFTTTGASILSDVEALSHASLLWRSFTHWVGGMGVLVFVLAIVPLSGGSNINLMKAESPGPSVGKLMPHLKQTAMTLYLIYIFMTVAEFIILAIGKMPVFDNLCITFGTAGTGGFAIRNSGCADYTVFQQWVITIFMILFGVNFNSYYCLFAGDVKKAFKSEEVRTYFGIIGAAIAIICINTYHLYGSLSMTLTKAAFQVGSIITTTGYATTDFNLWPALSKSVLVSLMFIGACAGSTGGGIKVSRICIVMKSFLREVDSYIHPKSVKQVKMDGEPIEKDTVRAVNVYISTFILIFSISVLLVSIEGRDFTTNFTAVVSAMNNIGPGLNEVGPMENFGELTTLSKFVLIVDMLAGRLELYPIVLFFDPVIWKDFVMDSRASRRKRLARIRKAVRRE